VTEKYKGLVPYFVLGGLQGLRTCEIIKEPAAVVLLQQHLAIPAHDPARPDSESLLAPPL
jgi:hypothetical protein